MQERNAQMALRLHQMTGEPLAHCTYLLDQTNGDYETALKILERILQQRREGTQGQAPADAQSTPASLMQQGPQTLEERVARLENQLGQLTVTLETMTNQLSLLLDKLSGSDSA